LSLSDILSLFLKCLLPSYGTLFQLSSFILFGYCNKCSLACFTWFNNFGHPLSNYGLCFFNS
jgi:hypothetical protein